MRQEYHAVTRFPEVNKRLEQSGINWTLVPEATDEQLNMMPGVDEFRRNYLRVHVYMQEMNYMRVKDESSYLVRAHDRISIYIACEWYNNKITRHVHTFPSVNG